MPKTRPLTEALRREEAERLQRERTILIFKAAAIACGLSYQEMAKIAGVEYQAFCRRMRGAAEFKLPELCNLANGLRLDPLTRAAICGAKEKCRFEIGYRPDLAAAAFSAAR